MNEVLDTILAFLQDMNPVVRTALAGLAIMLETSVLIGLVVPGDTVVIVSALGVQGTAEYFALAFTVIVGALVGESIGFGIGRFFGPRLRASRLGERIGKHRFDVADRFVDKRGGVAVFVSRFLPIFHSLVPMVAGLSRMPYRRFMAWTAPACTLWAFIYVSVGSAAAGSYDQLKEQFEWASWLFLGIIVGFVVLVQISKRLLTRFAEHEADKE